MSPYLNQNLFNSILDCKTPTDIDINNTLLNITRFHTTPNNRFKFLDTIKESLFSHDKNINQYILDVVIIPSLWSRIGDVKPSVDSYNYTDIFTEHMKLLKYLKVQLPNSLPSPEDSFKIDSKIYYMQHLRDAGLCDPNTVICYGFNEDETLKLDKKSEELLSQFKKNEVNDYFLKTAFGGANNCSTSINIELDTIINKKFIDKKLINTDEFSHKESRVNCIGYNLGFLIQKKNDQFENSVFGELRCFCYKGNIIAICSKQKKGKISHYTFVTQVFHESLSLMVKKQIEKSELNINNELFKELLQKLVAKYLPDNDYKYDINEYLINGMSTEFFESEQTNIPFNEILQSILDSKICKTTFDILKNELKIHGEFHRIDLINTNDTYTKFVVNEVENINYGNITDKCLETINPFRNEFKYVDESKTNIFKKRKIEDLEEGLEFLTFCFRNNKKGLLKTYLSELELNDPISMPDNLNTGDNLKIYIYFSSMREALLGHYDGPVSKELEKFKTESCFADENYNKFKEFYENKIAQIKSKKNINGKMGGFILNIENKYKNKYNSKKLLRIKLKKKRKNFSKFKTKFKKNKYSVINKFKKSRKNINNKNGSSQSKYLRKKYLFNKKTKKIKNN